MARRIFREGLRLLVVTICFLLVVDTWICGGIFLPLEIVGASMAPRLMGEHLFYRCACGESFRVLVPEEGGNNRVICPACGSLIPRDSGLRMPADRVLVLRPGPWACWPRRWQVVCLRSWESPHACMVKRVAAVPGDEVSSSPDTIRLKPAKMKDLPRNLWRLSLPLFRAHLSGLCPTEHPEATNGRRPVAVSTSSNPRGTKGWQPWANPHISPADCSLNNGLGNRTKVPFVRVSEVSLVRQDPGGFYRLTGFLCLGGLPENQLYVLPQDNTFRLAGLAARVRVRLPAVGQNLGIRFKVGSSEAWARSNPEGNVLRCGWRQLSGPSAGGSDGTGERLPGANACEMSGSSSRTLPWPQTLELDLLIWQFPGYTVFATGGEVAVVPRTGSDTLWSREEPCIPLSLEVHIEGGVEISGLVEVRGLYHCIDILANQCSLGASGGPGSSPKLPEANYGLGGVVRPGEFVLLGDNWVLSRDSRHFGLVKLTGSPELIGVGVLKIRWSAWRVGSGQLKIPLLLPVDYIW